MVSKLFLTSAVAAAVFAGEGQARNSRRQAVPANADGQLVAAAIASSVNANVGNDGTQLAPNAIQTGSQFDGQDALGANDDQAPALISNNNFINFCAGKTLTNGLQITTGSCNGIVMGDIPAKDKMVSAVILSPQTGEVVAANQDFDVVMQVTGLVAGAFTNAIATYYSVPQFLSSQGLIVGHSHVTCQDLGNSLNPTTPPNPEQFAFFKGIDDAGNGRGLLKATVTGGLPKGFFRCCSLNSGANHQPVVMPVAQRGSTDDCVKFEVGDVASKPGEALAAAQAAAANATEAAANATAAAEAASKGDNNNAQGNNNNAQGNQQANGRQGQGQQGQGQQAQGNQGNNAQGNQQANGRQGQQAQGNQGNNAQGNQGNNAQGNQRAQGQQAQGNQGNNAQGNQQANGRQGQQAQGNQGNNAQGNQGNNAQGNQRAQGQQAQGNQGNNAQGNQQANGRQGQQSQGQSKQSQGQQSQGQQSQGQQSQGQQSQGQQSQGQSQKSKGQQAEASQDKGKQQQQDASSKEADKKNERLRRFARREFLA